MESNFSYAKGLTKDEDIKMAIEKKVDVLEALSQEIMSDSDSKSSQVLDRYMMADEKERAAMDALLIDVCGWSMASLIEIAERDGIYEDDDFLEE